jgi:hypothetical protein
MLTVGFQELAAGSQAGEMFHKKPAFPPSTEAKFADQLFVTGALAG